ncbi:MAG: DUF5610 domain-containing protein [Deltaproteobacteria bacterium]|nr:DUF5610 domain-containing protein [Deltaproteobacteria bacterium]
MKQHPEMDEATALNEYQKLVTNAVNSGYQDALAVLSTLGVDDRGVLDTAKETIDLTFEKLNNFFRRAPGRARRGRECVEFSSSRADAREDSPTYPSHHQTGADHADPLFFIRAGRCSISEKSGKGTPR